MKLVFAILIIGLVVTFLSAIEEHKRFEARQIVDLEERIRTHVPYYGEAVVALDEAEYSHPFEVCNGELVQVGPIYGDKFPVHLNMVGDTGCGKTSCGLQPMARQALSVGMGVVFLDGKGDPKVCAFLEDEAKKRGAPFRVLRTNGVSHGADILRQIKQLAPHPNRRVSLLEKHLGTDDPSKPYFSSQTREVLLKVDEHYPEISTYQELYSILQNGESPVYESSRQFEHTAFLRSAVSTYARYPALNVTASDSRREVREHLIDFVEFVQQGGVLYIDVEPLLGSLIMVLLQEAAKIVNECLPESEQHRVLFIVDEFPVFMSSGDLLRAYLDRCRSIGVHCLLAHQSYGQLKVEGGEALLSSVMAIPASFFFGSNEPVTNEALQRDLVEWVNHDADGQPTYHRRPRLTASQLQFLCGSPYANRMFVAKLNREAEGFLFGRAQYAVSRHEFEKHERRGWPTIESLPGAIDPLSKHSRQRIASNESPPAPSMDDAEFLMNVNLED